ncbi:DinB family protein [Candidatus Roizmanbacteria bacterium]|nr:DinB family protein [Candidatus Roizmanbacteria bacterium]
MITALQLIKDQLKEAHEMFLQTVADIKEDHLHKNPGGKALPLGSLYAHLLYSEDVIVQGMIRGKAPLYTTLWKDKTGASAPMPAMDDKWEANHVMWSKKVKIDLTNMNKYGKAVFTATEKYVDSLKGKDLERIVDLGSWGKKTVASLLCGFVIGHANSLTGEISAVKGINGAKGYPF